MFLARAHREHDPLFFASHVSSFTDKAALIAPLNELLLAFFTQGETIEESERTPFFVSRAGFLSERARGGRE